VLPAPATPPTNVTRYKWVHVVASSTPLYLAVPSALVSVDTLNGDTICQNTSGGYLEFMSVGIFMVSVTVLGTRAQPGLGALGLNQSNALFFPMESFTFPSSSNFSMYYLVETTSALARFRPYLASTAATQTVECIITVVQIVPDF
jgi:hypothetical protein